METWQKQRESKCFKIMCTFPQGYTPQHCYSKRIKKNFATAYQLLFIYRVPHMELGNPEDDISTLSKMRFSIHPSKKAEGEHDTGRAKESERTQYGLIIE